MKGVVCRQQFTTHLCANNTSIEKEILPAEHCLLSAQSCSTTSTIFTELEIRCFGSWQRIGDKVNGFVCCTSLPLASTGWVRSTFKQVTAVDKSPQHREIPKKILVTLRIKPKVAWQEARILFTVLCPPPTRSECIF